MNDVTSNVIHIMKRFCEKLKIPDSSTSLAKNSYLKGRHAAARFLSNTHHILDFKIKHAWCNLMYTNRSIMWSTCVRGTCARNDWMNLRRKIVNYHTKTFMRLTNTQISMWFSATLALNLCVLARNRRPHLCIYVFETRYYGINNSNDALVSKICESWYGIM